MLLPSSVIGSDALLEKRHAPKVPPKVFLILGIALLSRRALLMDDASLRKEHLLWEDFLSVFQIRITVSGEITRKTWVK